MTSTKGHIAFTIGRPIIGGVQKVVLRVASELVRKGFTCSVIPLKEPKGDLASVFEDVGIGVNPCLYYPEGIKRIPSERVRKYLAQVSFVRRFRALLRSLGITFVNSQSSFKISNQGKVVVGLGLPWVWTLQGQHTIVGAGAPEISKVVEMVNRTPRTFVTGVSQHTIQAFKAAYPIQAEKTHVIPNCVTLPASQCVRSEESRAKLREFAGIPLDCTVFGAAGRLTPVKRLDLIIDGAVQVIALDQRCHFTLAGEGELENDLRRHVASKGLVNYFHFVGFQKNIVDYLNMIDVFVMSSDTEGTPLSLLEACAMGIPAVTTSVGGIPEILGPDGGILVEPNSVESLVEGLKQMLNQDVRQSYTRRLERIAEQYSPEKIATEYEALYEDLLIGLR